MRKLSSLIFVLLFTTITVFAGGYQIRLQGQQQTTMGLIGTPLIFGSSGIFYNPGTLSFMKNQYDFSAGVSFVISNVTFQKDGTDYQTQTNNPVKPPFAVYGAYKINDKIAVGIGIYTPFGSTTKWDDDWAGKMLIQNISLKAVYVQPTISYKITEDLGIGIGIIYATGDVKLQKGLPYSDNANAKLDGSTSSWGYNIGLFYKASDKLTLGIDYRSKIQMKMKEGSAIFTVPQSLNTTIPASNLFNAELPMPANLDIGVAYKFDEKFTLAAEINYVFWSAYQSLDFTFAQNGELLNSVNPREYINTLIFRLGGEYKLNEKIIIRVGAYYDPSPTSDIYFNPETVSLNTMAFTFGATYNYSEKLQFTISYLQTNGLETDKAYQPARFSGKYQSVANIPGFGIRYRF
jgi:long-chain fatty acid transport protein